MNNVPHTYLTVGIFPPMCFVLRYLAITKEYELIMMCAGEGQFLAEHRWIINKSIKSINLVLLL